MARMHKWTGRAQIGVNGGVFWLIKPVIQNCFFSNFLSSAERWNSEALKVPTAAYAGSQSGSGSVRNAVKESNNLPDYQIVSLAIKIKLGRI